MPKSSIEFEKSLADLSYSYINNNAPKLLDYLVGFQVLNQNDDETEALGVFGFSVGGKKKDMYYAPVFFLSGKLKGQELLYNANSDKFMPLEEAWVDFILNKKVVQIGEPAGESLSDLSRYLPNFREMLGQGMAKSATTVDPLGEEGIYGKTILGESFDLTPALGMFFSEHKDDLYKKAAENLDLANIVGPNGCPAVAKVLAARMANDPEFTKMAMQFYSVEDFCGDSVDVVEDVVEPVVVKKAAEAVPVPMFIESWNAFQSATMSDQQQKDFVKQGFIVVDKRKDGQKNKVIEGDISLTNPSTVGMFDVVFDDFSIKRCLLTKKFPVSTSSFGECKDWLLFKGSDKVLRVAKTIITTTSEPLDGVESFKDLRKLKSGGDSNGFSSYIIDTKNGDTFESYMSNQRIIESENVSSMTEADGCDIIVPKGRCKMITVKYDCVGGEDKKKPLENESISLFDAFPKRTIRALKVGNGYEFKSAYTAVKKASVLDATKYLILNVGLSKEAADHVLLKSEEPYEFITKEAAFEDENNVWATIDDLDRTAGVEPWSGARITTDEERDIPVQGLERNHRADYGEMDPPETDHFNTMRRAVATKQKDVFDVSAFESMLGIADVDGAVDGYLPDLVNSIDKLGRAMFLMYANMDDFKERYGQEDLKDLEESLKSAFSTNGKLVLFMKRRAINKDIDGEGVEL